MHLKLKGLYDLAKQGASQSLLTTFMACRQKAKLKIEGWRSLKPGDALLFGTLAHHVIGEAFASLSAPPARTWLVKTLREGIELIEEEHGGRLSPEALENLEKSAAVMLRLLPAYFNYYVKDFSSKDWIKVETNFKVQLEGVPFPLVGRYDRVRKIHMRPWLYETKTKSRVEEDQLTEILHFDVQLGVYLSALTVELKEFPAGVLYDIVRRPQLKQKVNESEDAFLQRIEEDIASRPEFYFIRFEVSLGKEEVAAFGRELASISQEYADWVAGKLATYKNTTACKQSWGLCEYVPICARGDYDRFVKKPGDLFPELARASK